VLRLSRGPPSLPRFLWPELTGRLIQDRERSALQLFPLPLLEQAQSALVGFGSSRQHQSGTRGQEAGARKALRAAMCDTPDGPAGRKVTTLVQESNHGRGKRGASLTNRIWSLVPCHISYGSLNLLGRRTL